MTQVTDQDSLTLTREQAAEIQAAARAIQDDGVDGLYTAARIVGKERALAMLVMFLRCDHYDKKVWPIPDTVTHRTNGDLVRAGALTLREDALETKANTFHHHV
jgi:hypothetical protein